MKKGDIVLIPFPFTNLKGTKRRPAIILHLGDSDVIVSFITSKIAKGNTLDLLVQPNEGNGLKKASLIKTDKIATLEAELIPDKIGAINKDQINDLNLKLKQLLGID